MKIYHQSVFDSWPLEDNSVQAVITSPPYYSLRKYDIPDVIIGGDKNCQHQWDNTYEQSFCNKCKAFKGQYGLEPTFQLYIKHTLLWCKEVYRVLKDDGIFFLNLGDSYCSEGSPSRHWGYNDPKYPNGRAANYTEPATFPQTISAKCLFDIPHRVSIALIDELGFIKRNNIIWYKPNSLPESVKDRFSKKYEMIFMFTKNKKYYFNLDAVQEPWKQESIERIQRGMRSEKSKYNDNNIDLHKIAPAAFHRKRLNIKTLTKLERAIGRLNATYSDPLKAYHPLGKNPGDVWAVNTQPSKERHYAMWPEELVRRMILCSTKEGDIVLDPFCGSGRTLKVAINLNRVGIGIDLGYREIQDKFLNNLFVKIEHL